MTIGQALRQRVSLTSGACFIDGNKLDLDGVEFLELLPEGANGVVLKALQRDLNRKVAVKVWLAREGDRRDKLKQAVAEARKMATLDHPNIVRIYSSHVLKQKYFVVVMEFLRGTTLREILRQRVSSSQRILIWRKISDTIKFTHKDHVYHGDLHPGNIMVSDDDIKLIDFGTSVFSVRRRQAAERESRMLGALVRTMFSESEMIGIVDVNWPSLKPEIALEVCDAWVHMIGGFAWIKDRGVASYDHLQHLFRLLCRVPLFNPEKVAAQLRSLNVSEDNLKELIQEFNWTFRHVGTDYDFKTSEQLRHKPIDFSQEALRNFRTTIRQDYLREAPRGYYALT